MATEAVSADEVLESMERNWPEAVTPVSQMILRLLRLNALIRQNASATMCAHGLSFTEFHVLLALRREAPPYELAPTALYDAAVITSGGMTKVLRALEDRELIVRREDKADRRVKPVALTKSGQRLIEETMSHVVEADGALLARGLKPKEMRDMTNMLQKLLLAIEPVEASGT